MPAEGLQRKTTGVRASVCFIMHASCKSNANFTQD